MPVVLFGIGTPHLSAGLSTIMASSELPCGIAISVLVLSEPVDALQTAGIAVIMLGVPFGIGFWLGRVRERAKTRKTGGA